MKQIQKYRLGIQMLCLVLTIIGFFINFQITTVIILLFTLFAGVFYCGWVCPYGFIQDIFSRLGNFLGIKKRKMPKSIQKILVFSRYILALIILAISADFIYGIMTFDPRVNFGNILVGNAISTIAVLIIILFSLIALFFDRPFCNYLCMEGAKYGLMSSLRPFTIKRNQNTCINCKKCDKSCPMNIHVSKCSNMRTPQCINCFQCLSSCPVENTLTYGRVGITKRYAMVVVCVFIVISTFLVYNIFNGNSIKSTPESMGHDTTSGNISYGKEVTDDESDIKKEDTSTNETNVELTSNLGAAVGLDDGVYTGQGVGFRGVMTVDVVTGATYSSLGIIDGVNDAIENAN